MRARGVEVAGALVVRGWAVGGDPHEVGEEGRLEGIDEKKRLLGVGDLAIGLRTASVKIG